MRGWRSLTFTCKKNVYPKTKLWLHQMFVTCVRTIWSQTIYKYIVMCVSECLKQNFITDDRTAFTDSGHVRLWSRVHVIGIQTKVVFDIIPRTCFSRVCVRNFWAHAHASTTRRLHTTTSASDHFTRENNIVRKMGGFFLRPVSVRRCLPE